MYFHSYSSIKLSFCFRYRSEAKSRMLQPNASLVTSVKIDRRLDAELTEGGETEKAR